MKIRLVAPKTVYRPVVRSMHFPRRAKEDIKRIDDPRLRKRMLRDWPEKPYGHDSILLKCGHVITKWRTKPGLPLWKPQPCKLCTVREDEMSVRYIRADMKKKRRVKKERSIDRSAKIILKIRRKK
jgi:hypothetical protein